MDIIQALKEELQIGRNQVEAAVKLIDEGNTIPFIARYRKEATGSLNDEVLRQLDERLRYLRNLEDKKEQVIGAIRAQEKLTPALEKQIRDAATLVAVEDLYLPYRPKRRTRAGIAREKGLEPLAVWIYKQEAGGSLEAEAAKYVSEEKGVADVSEAIDGARDILAEQISEMAKYRNYARKKTMQDGLLEASAKDEKIQSVYEMYYHFSEPVKKLAGHRVLAINRGEKEKILSVKLIAPEEQIVRYMEKQLIIRPDGDAARVMEEVILDSYRRLIGPAIEREIRAGLTETAENGAIQVFGKNLEQLLMQPPIAGCVVLGWDPAFRTGCKLAVVDETGKVLDTTVIYPTAPQNRVEESKEIVKKLIRKYGISLISVGNGTASRESEQIIVELLKEIPEKVQYVIVNEAGASVYSASKLATEEFPQFDVGQRSAASIARRLQDPLAELVKIDPNGDTIYEAKDYIKNITSIKIDGQALGGKKANISEIAKTVFNENTGAVNFDAKVNNTAVFAKGDGGSYNVELTSSGFNDVTGTVTQDSGEYKYVYAGLTWEQYWASEGVYEATNTSASEDKDRRGESDMGGFDAVTRATANHGLHRGSFQTMATVYDANGKTYALAGWKDKTTMILTDGSTVSCSKGKINGIDVTEYKVTGLKYIPVKVKTADYDAFKKAFKVVENGEKLFGGYAENNLSAYEETAEVNANTNGLKTATKDGDTFTFSARANGTTSGLKGEALKTADGITTKMKPGSGSYGEFLRVDLTGNYGGLGGAMQAVKWTYYGNDSTYSKPVQTYGTKFAASSHRDMTEQDTGQLLSMHLVMQTTL